MHMLSEQDNTGDERLVGNESMREASVLIRVRDAFPRQ